MCPKCCLTHLFSKGSFDKPLRKLRSADACVRLGATLAAHGFAGGGVCRALIMPYVSAR